MDVDDSRTPARSYSMHGVFDGWRSGMFARKGNIEMNVRVDIDSMNEATGLHGAVRIEIWLIFHLT